MAVINNIVTQNGDCLLIQAEAPVTGLVGLTDFIDSVQGENSNRFWKKEFRYSIDGGINWTNFQELNNANLQAVSVNVTNLFKIEYLYTRQGSDNTGSLQFDNISLNGTFVQNACGEAYSNSIFSQFFDCNDTEVLAWCIAMSQKLYDPGIVPQALERKVGDSISNDQDYLDFWSTVSCFFAIIVTFARQFKDFNTNEILLFEYLKQRNLFICEGTELSDLIYLMQRYFDEIAKRGTEKIIEKRNENRPVDGELLRLICFNADCDEFIFDVSSATSIGWKLGNSSPLYKGINSKLIKGYEDTESAQDISNYPLLGSPYVDIYEEDFNGNRKSIDILSIDLTRIIKADFIKISIEYNFNSYNFNYTFDNINNFSNQILSFFNSIDTNISISKLSDIDYKIFTEGVLKISYLEVSDYIYISNQQSSTINVVRCQNVPTGQFGGIGNWNEIRNFPIIIDPSLDYEITCKVQITDLSDPNSAFVFGVGGFDKNFIRRDFIRADSNLSGNKFINASGYINSGGFPKTGINSPYYPVRGIIYSSNSAVKSSQDVSINNNMGSHLRFNSDMVYLVAEAYLDNISGTSSTNEIRILDFKIRPLNYDKSNGFLNTSNMIRAWLKNNNGDYSNKQITNIIQKYLIPYNFSSDFVYL